MKTVIISPYSRKLRDGKNNPKNYPHWPKVVNGLRKLKIKTIHITEDEHEDIGADEVKVGVRIPELTPIIMAANTWCSVDNFMGHFGAYLKKPGVVLFGKSDPRIFGYPSNINLLKDRKHLRQWQFNWWEGEMYDPNVFVSPEIVVQSLQQLISGVKRKVDVLQG